MSLACWLNIQGRVCTVLYLKEELLGPTFWPTESSRIRETRLFTIHVDLVLQSMCLSAFLELLNHGILV